MKALHFIPLNVGSVLLTDSHVERVTTLFPELEVMGGEAVYYQGRYCGLIIETDYEIIDFIKDYVSLPYYQTLNDRGKLKFVSMTISNYLRWDDMLMQQKLPVDELSASDFFYTHHRLYLSVDPKNKQMLRRAKEYMAFCGIVAPTLVSYR